MKRSFAILTAAVLTSAFTGSLLSGCGIKGTDASALGIYGEHITSGEWLQILNEKFGFTPDSESEPYFASVPQDDPYYSAVQTAVSMEVLPEDYEALDTKDQLTREFCAVTLAGALYFANPDDAMQIADLGDCKYPEQVRTVVNDGIMALDEQNKFCPAEEILYVDASICLEDAYRYWADMSFDDAVYDYTMQEGVVDLAGVSTIAETEDGKFEPDASYVQEQAKLLKDQHFSYDAASGTMTMDDPAALGFSEGTVTVFPDENSITGMEAARIVTITKLPDGTYSCDTEGVTPLDIFGEMDYRENVEPQFNELTLLDENDNPIRFDSSAADAGAGVEPTAFTGFDSRTGLPLAETLGSGRGGEIVPLEEMHVEKTFDDGFITDSFSVPITDKLTAKVSMTPRGFKITVESKVKSGGNNKLEKGKGSAIKQYLEQLDKEKENAAKLDKSKIGGMLTRDYSLKDDLKGSLSRAGSVTLGVENISFHNALEVKKSKHLHIPYGVKYLKSSVSFDQTVKLTGSLGAEASATLFKVVVPTGVPLLNLVFKVEMKVSLTGEVSINIKTSGIEKGMELRNGSLQKVHEEGKRTTDIKGELIAELTLPLSLKLVVVSEKVGGGYAELDLGVGLNLAGKLNKIEVTADGTDQQYTIPLLCTDVKLYGIVKIKVGASFFKFDESKTFDMLNKDNGTFSYGHFEGLTFKQVSQCTAGTQSLQKKGMDAGESLELNMGNLELAVGESAEIRITKIPTRYSVSKDVIVGLNKLRLESPVTFDNSRILVPNTWTKFTQFAYNLGAGGSFKSYLSLEGDDPSVVKVTAKEAGDILVTFRTKDSYQQATCLIRVTEQKPDAPLVTLPATGNFKLNKDYLTMKPGTGFKLTFSELPNGVTEADVLWDSDDTSIAAVDNNGNVIAIAQGVANIIARTADGRYRFSCTVSVSESASPVVTEKPMMM